MTSNALAQQITEETAETADNTPLVAAPEAVAEKKKRQLRPREREVFSNPIITRSIQISTQQAQRIANRSLEYASYSLFSLDVILPIIGEKEEITIVETMIINSMKEVIVDIDKQLAQLKALLDSSDISELTAYSNPKIFNVDVQSPQIAQFLSIILKLDELVKHIDTLWLNGELKSFERSDQNHIWQRRISRLATKIVDIEKRARKSAHEKGKGEEVELAAPKKTTEMLPDEADNDESDE